MFPLFLLPRVELISRMIAFIIIFVYLIYGSTYTHPTILLSYSHYLPII